MEATKILSLVGEEIGSIELSEAVFNVMPSEHAIYQAVTSYMVHQRQGNASTKTRSQVNRSGSKPRRQKGYGMARIGTFRSPLLVGGGVAFGPHPHPWKAKLPKKVRRLAVKSALSLKAKDGQIKVVEDLELDEPKTKVVADMLSALGLKEEKSLYLVSSPSPEILKSSRNISNLTVRRAKDVCTYDILNSDVLLISRNGLRDIEERFAQ